MKTTKRKRPKNICKCGKKMRKEYDDCMCCGGVEYYQCENQKCYAMYDLKGNEI